MDDISYDRFEGLTSDGLVCAAATPIQATSTSWACSTLRQAGRTGCRLLRAMSVSPTSSSWPRTGWFFSTTATSAGEGEGGPLRWWSFPLPEGETPRTEPDFEGASLAWGDGVRVTVFQDGRVVVSTGAGDRLVADEPPVGCERLADLPVMVGLAGTRPVVTSWCGDESTQPVTVVYDIEGRMAVQIAGSRFLAADGSLVLLAGGTDEVRGRTYLLDLDGLTH
jgi:hypothetical protein